MLNGTLALHDIRDTEAFVKAIIDRTKPAPTHHDREDIAATLIAITWELSTLNPQPWRTSFAGWITPTLRLRIIDWRRQHHGRTRWTQPRTGNGTQYADLYERHLPELIPIHDLTVRDLAATAEMDTRGDRDTNDLLRILRAGASDEALRECRLHPANARRAA